MSSEKFSARTSGCRDGHFDPRLDGRCGHGRFLRPSGLRRGTVRYHLPSAQEFQPLKNRLAAAFRDQHHVPSEFFPCSVPRVGNPLQWRAPFAA